MPKRYNDVEKVKEALESNLNSYINRNMSQDNNYLSKNVSENANTAFERGIVNEVVVDVVTLGSKSSDKYLLDLVKVVLRYGFYKRS